jgi:hypothetical protein
MELCIFCLSGWFKGNNVTRIFVEEIKFLSAKFNVLVVVDCGFLLIVQGHRGHIGNV